jgi:hypothetical protein
VPLAKIIKRTLGFGEEWTRDNFVLTKQTFGDQRNLKGIINLSKDSLYLICQKLELPKKSTKHLNIYNSLRIYPYIHKTYTQNWIKLVKTHRMVYNLLWFGQQLKGIKRFKPIWFNGSN